MACQYPPRRIRAVLVCEVVDDVPDNHGETGAGTWLVRSAARGTLREVGWIAAHLAFYPLGTVSQRFSEPADRYTLTGLSPLRRGLLVADIEAAGMPVLLLHGLVDNRSIFVRMRRALGRRGFDRVSTVNIPLYTSDVESAARRLATLVEATCQLSGYSRLRIVAHSLGGLVSRYYIQRMGGDARVHTLITLGTPHGGTSLTRLLPDGIPHRLVAAMRPGSALLRCLGEPAPGCATRFVAFAGELDSLVRPVRSAHIRHPDLYVRNISVAGVGHHALPFNNLVMHKVAGILSTVTEPPPVGGAPTERAGTEDRLIPGIPDTSTTPDDTDDTGERAAPAHAG